MIKIIFFGYSSCGDSQTVESWEEVQEDWLHILQQAVLRSRPEPPFFGWSRLQLQL